jgi:hypothetical protein
VSRPQGVSAFRERWMSARVVGVLGCLVVGLLILAACSSPQPRESESPSAATSKTVSPSPTIDPRAQPAVDAYEAFAAASTNASRDPLPLGSTYAPAADYALYSFDPMRTQTSAYLAGLAEQKAKFRGSTPPTPRVRVKSVELDTKPYPTVMLTDCQSPTSDWDEYDQAGNRVPNAPATASPPYLVTAKMIYYKDHWGLQSTTADTSRTCTG